MTAGIADVLRALADLAPGDRTPDDVVDVAAGDQPFLWLGLDVDASGLFVGQHPQPREPLSVIPKPFPAVPRSSPARRLQGFDALHREERLLRCGWVFLCGRVEVDGRPRRICMPLAVRPVRLHSPALGRFIMQPLGDLEVLGGLGTDPMTYDHDFGSMPAPELLDRYPRLRQWVDQVVAAAGYPPIADLLGPQARPEKAKRRDDLVAVLGYAVYVDRAAAPAPRASALLDWADVEHLDRTALARLYGVSGHRAGAKSADEEWTPSPLPLTDAQAEVVHRSRRQPVTAVSGAPGNGKSHAVCAIAVDAVARGESVLITTPTPYAADVLGELLARQPGPEPVLFGETEGRRRMIATLESLGQRTVDEYDLASLRESVRRASAERAAREEAVVGALDREVRAERAARWTLRLPELRAAVPGVFAPGADLAEVSRLVDRVRARPGWWRRRRLRRLTGCAPIVGVDAVADAVEACRDVRAELELDTIGGTTIGAAWDALLTAEAAEAEAEGELVDALARDEERWDAVGWVSLAGKGRRAVAALLRALPAGRSTRRDLLADIDAEALVRALPLWIGTLRDAEDLLPARPGLFDLVIVDEAAQVDQFRAAGALLRARRAVVVGDPRQLRHVSFVADDDVAAALERHGVAALADRLDVRRQSLFDVAAGAAPVTFLDEHHRSVPHLIDFSARRFYEGRVLVATRNPSNESDDVIDLVRVADVPAEVATVVDLIASMVAAGRVGIGAYTPFRAHADAIEAAVLDRFEPEVIEAHGLRTGTAHAAQGSERDDVIIAFGLSLDDPPARWRFAQDPNLFNVLVTRARRHLTVVTALPEAGVPRGIVADYLRHASAPPAPPASGPPPTPWIAAPAAELERNHIPVRVGYPVGRWHVDICAGVGADAVAAAVDLSRSLRPPGTSFPTSHDPP